MIPNNTILWLVLFKSFLTLADHDGCCTAALLCAVAPSARAIGSPRYLKSEKDVRQGQMGTYARFHADTDDKFDVVEKSLVG